MWCATVTTRIHSTVRRWKPIESGGDGLFGAVAERRPVTHDEPIEGKGQRLVDAPPRRDAVGKCRPAKHPTQRDPIVK